VFGTSFSSSRNILFVLFVLLWFWRPSAGCLNGPKVLSFRQLATRRQWWPNVAKAPPLHAKEILADDKKATLGRWSKTICAVVKQKGDDGSVLELTRCRKVEECPCSGGAGACACPRGFSCYACAPGARSAPAAASNLGRCAPSSNEV
jgi:hypothetical protein